MASPPASPPRRLILFLLNACFFAAAAAAASPVQLAPLSMTAAPSPDLLHERLNLVKQRDPGSCASSCVSAAVVKSTPCKYGDLGCECSPVNAFSISLGASPCILLSCGGVLVAQEAYSYATSACSAYSANPTKAAQAATTTSWTVYATSQAAGSGNGNSAAQATGGSGSSDGSTQSSGSGNGSTATNSSAGGSGLSAGAIAGIAIGAAAVGAIIAIAAWWLCRRTRKRSTDDIQGQSVAQPESSNQQKPHPAVAASPVYTNTVYTSASTPATHTSSYTPSTNTWQSDQGQTQAHLNPTLELGANPPAVPELYSHAGTPTYEMPAGRQ